MCWVLWTRLPSPAHKIIPDGRANKSDSDAFSLQGLLCASKQNLKPLSLGSPRKVKARSKKNKVQKQKPINYITSTQEH
jgi:hypothetical protein